MGTHLRALDAELDAIPGTVSVWCGPVGGPSAYARLADATHYAASTMKVAVLAALYRAAEAARLSLDTSVPVHNDFESAVPVPPGAAAVRFGCSPESDSDRVVWQRLGENVPLRWLARRMIVRSSNLATNIVLSHLGSCPGSCRGLDAVNEVWRLAGATHSVTGRAIEDTAARAAGISNQVTAADLAALLAAITTGNLLSPQARQEVLDVLLAQEHRDDLAAGLPAGTRVAHKGGWVKGVRHGAGVVFPDDSQPYVVVVCTTTGLTARDGGVDPARQLVARVAAASWADRATFSA